MRVMRPEKAILLAAGFGTRMQPLSWDLPKPMMPVWGTPAIVHTINLMRQFGVHEVLINLHHHPTPLLDYFRRNPVSDMKIEFSFESEILGTGGAIRKAAWFLDDAPFWIINTDIAADVSPAPFLQEFQKNNPLAVLWLHPELGPRTVEMTDNRITCFRSKTPGMNDTYTFCGLQLVSPEIVDYLPPADFSSIVDAYSAGMMGGRRISGITVENCFWADIGNPSDYITAHRDILKAHLNKTKGKNLFNTSMLRQSSSLKHRGVNLSGFMAIGPGVVIEPGAQITDSVIWEGASIKKTSNLQNAIVSRNVTVTTNLSGPVIMADKIPGEPELKISLKQMGWPETETSVMPLAARGSARTFTRLSHRGRSVIFVRYSTERPENSGYAGHSRFLTKHSIPVPGNLLDNPSGHFSVFEDLGDISLEQMTRTIDDAQIEKLYKKVLDALLALHRITRKQIKTAGIKLQPSFSQKLYKWERELFAEHFLFRHMGHKTGIGEPVLKDLEIIADHLQKLQPVLLHRDMQSSNILLLNSRPFFIDFQGMRMGPAVYDIASLLCDPYVMLSPSIQDRLISYYAARYGNSKEFEKAFWFAAVQRLAQALGAYGRLSAMPATRRFSNYFKPAIEMMSRALGQTEGLHNLKEMTRAYHAKHKQVSRKLPIKG